MAANPRFTWHKLTCPAGCGRVERYRGLAVLGAPGHMCYGCHLGPMRVSEVHWGHEKYATSRSKAGTVEKLPKGNPAMHVASLLFDKRVFTAAQAKAWAHAHGYRYGTLEAGGPASRYWHLPQQFSGRVKRIVPFGSRYSGIRAIVARNPGDPRVAVGVGPARLYKYRYYPGALDLVDPHVIVGTRLQPGAYVRLLAKRPAGGRTIRGWSKTFAWVQDQHGSEQIVFRRALHKAR